MFFEFSLSTARISRKAQSCVNSGHAKNPEKISSDRSMCECERE
jgi:hypothetical protein